MGQNSPAYFLNNLFQVQRVSNKTRGHCFFSLCSALHLNLFLESVSLLVMVYLLRSFLIQLNWWMETFCFRWNGSKCMVPQPVFAHFYKWVSILKHTVCVTSIIPCKHVFPLSSSRLFQNYLHKISMIHDHLLFLWAWEDPGATPSANENTV